MFADERGTWYQHCPHDVQHSAWQNSHTRTRERKRLKLGSGSEGCHGAHYAALRACPVYPARLRAAQPARELRPSHNAPWPESPSPPSKQW